MIDEELAKAAFIGVCVGALLVFLFLLGGLELKSDHYWHRQIIQHGAGRYNPTTAQFEWIAVDTGRAP